MPQPKEKQPQRKRPLSLVYVEMGANGGMVRDLSDDGFAVRAMMPVRAGDETPFVLALDEATRIEGRGKISHVEEAGFVASIDFLEMPEELRRQIRDWMNQSEKHVLRPTAAPAKSESQTMEELRQELRAPVAQEKRPTKAAPVEPVVASVPEAIPRNTTELEAALEAKPGPKADPNMQPLLEPLPHIAEVHAESASKPVGELGDEAPPLVLMQPLWNEHLHGPNEAPQEAPVLEAVGVSSAVEATERQEQAAASQILVNWADVTRALAFLLLIAALAGGYVFRRTLGHALMNIGQQLAGSEATSQSAVQPTPTSAPAQDADGSTSSQEKNSGEAKPANVAGNGAASPDATKSTTPGTSTAPVNVPTPAANPPSGSAATTALPRPANAATASASEPGQAEYNQAQTILRGKNRDAELGEAVRLLWISVEKGNAAAEVSLAGLYRLGQGVAKNCDQAHILLTAGARKGNSEAQRQLNAFEIEGCE